MENMDENHLYFDIKSNQWPIIYSPRYNVSFFGLEVYFPFDTKKWKHVFKILEKQKMVSKENIVEPNEPTKNDLLVTHKEAYLKKLKSSFYVSSIEENILLSLVPNVIIQKYILKPMRFQVGGTILAGKLALERGWSINIGGGFHHCSSDKGGGFCVYADITLLIHFLFKYFERIKKIMIVDLDAHQGNGYERDFLTNSEVYILDVFNNSVYPFDDEAKKAIKKRVELSPYTEDEQYLRLVTKSLKEAFDEFNPHLIVYNAGTDIIKGDPIGALSISQLGVISRDEIVFKIAKSKNVPIVMLTSGGYQKCNAAVIARSIMNLHKKGLINGPNI